MWLAAVFVAVLVAVQAVIQYPSFHPTNHGLDSHINLYPGHQPQYQPVNPTRDACALIIEGNGRSSLYDHTHSILFGGR